MCPKMKIASDYTAVELREVYEKYHSSKDFWKSVSEYLLQTDLQPGATWLCKHHTDQKKQIPAKVFSNLLLEAPKFSNWQSKLHVLQLLPAYSIPKHCLDAVNQLSHDALNADNKFLRAWGYQGVFELTKTKPELLPEAKAMFELALQREAASVRARVRHILKEL